MQQLAVQGQEAHLTAGQTGQDRVQVPVQETAPAQEQNCREFLIVPEQGEAVTEQEVIQIQAAEGEIPKVPGAPMAVLPEAEGPAEENTDHHLWQWY